MDKIEAVTDAMRANSPDGLIKNLERLGYTVLPLEPTPEMLSAAWAYTTSTPPERHMESQLMRPEDAHRRKMAGRYSAMVDEFRNPTIKAKRIAELQAKWNAA